MGLTRIQSIVGAPALERRAGKHGITGIESNSNEIDSFCINYDNNCQSQKYIKIYFYKVYSKLGKIGSVTNMKGNY
jgi:hypothetical protein